MSKLLLLFYNFVQINKTRIYIADLVYANALALPPLSLFPLPIQTIWQFACANKLQGKVSSLSVKRTLYMDRIFNVISRVPCLFSICSDLIMPPTTCRCL